jgi:hypothetical protein
MQFGFMVIHPLVVISFNKTLPRLKANAVESANLEPHSLCYTCWVWVCTHTCLSTLLFSWISSTAAQCPATWRTTSVALTTSRRLSPSRCPCGALHFMYFILRFRNSWTDSWFGCNKIIHLRFIYDVLRDMCYDILMILLYICVTWSWRIYDCSIYVFYKSGVTELVSEPYRL